MVAAMLADFEIEHVNRITSIPCEVYAGRRKAGYTNEPVVISHETTRTSRCGPVGVFHCRRAAT